MNMGRFLCITPDATYSVEGTLWREPRQIGDWLGASEDAVPSDLQFRAKALEGGGCS